MIYRVKAWFQQPEAIPKEPGGSQAELRFNEAGCCNQGKGPDSATLAIPFEPGGSQTELRFNKAGCCNQVRDWFWIFR